MDNHNTDAAVDSEDDNAIAVVGMACRLPGANNIGEYWANLRDGVESIEFFSDEELLAAGESAARLADPNYVNAQPVLAHFDEFDASFWGFNPQDAAVTDPAHRVFLEVAYHCLEHAGHTGFDAEDRVGVFASSGGNQYWTQNLSRNTALVDSMGEFLIRHTGNDMNFLATRLSYELDFRGPSVNVQAACSSALVGIHYAMQSLLSSECDLAIAGASTIMLPQRRGYLYREGEIMSPDGHCRPFDANSAGTVFGSGAGAIALRRLEDAIADGDQIYAVIRGSAINNDGAQKVGFLAPGVEGQAEVIAEALAVSEIDPAHVSYVEAHGTGTLVGDPIEFAALTQAFRKHTDEVGYCRVGSVKSNIGHLGEAASIASVIKVILALHHKQLPATINYESPNPEMDLANSPFVINDALQSWQPIDGRYIAGITALGAGGTNVHMLLEAPDLLEDDMDAEPSVRNQHLLTLSAKSPSALVASCHALAESLREPAETPLEDVAHTLSIGRRHYPYRASFTCTNTASAVEQLDHYQRSPVATGKQPPLIFMLPGGGAQYQGMGAELYTSNTVYQRAIDECLSHVKPELAQELKELLFGAATDSEAAAQSLARPTRSLVALFATEYAMAQVFKSWGLTPDALIGHSMGENTAACLAGVMTVREGIQLVEIRGELFEETPAGGMLSVALSTAILEPMLATHHQLSIAAVNAPELNVVSGGKDHIEKFAAQLTAQNIDYTPIHIDVAAHSPLLDSILDRFASFCRTLALQPPSIRFTSNLTGTWITNDQATDPEYWVNHLRNSVQFSRNLATIADDLGAPETPCVLLEIGPGRTLSSLAAANGVAAGTTCTSMPTRGDGLAADQFALEALGNLWTLGVAVDWQSYWGDELRRRVALPDYPFERNIYWVDAPSTQSAAVSAPLPSIAKQPDIDDWFAKHLWVQTGIPKPEPMPAQRWLVFVEGENRETLCTMLTDSAKEDRPAAQIYTVAAGTNFSSNNDHFCVDPGNPEHFVQLMTSVVDAAGQSSQESPLHIVYAWTLDSLATPKHMQTNAFWALFHLAKALGNLDEPMRLTILARHSQAVSDGDSQELNPYQALALGPALVIPRELPHVQTSTVDLIPELTLEQQADRILTELARHQPSNQIALRTGQRWERRVEPSYVPPDLDVNWVRTGGTYLITGGLGGIGLTLAQLLTEAGAGCLILLSRSGLPDPDQWPNWLDTHSAIDPKAIQIRKVQQLQAAGIEVKLPVADVTDIESLRNVLPEVLPDLQLLCGVIHSAGALDDAPIMIKTRASAENVLASKVQGAVNLDQVLANTELDFFVLFSSVASQLGLPGQIDYTAANAFLDAYAQQRNATKSGVTLAVNWNAWAEVGMAASAADTAQRLGDAALPQAAVAHPTIDRRIHSQPQTSRFETLFSVAEHWLLSDHRIRAGSCLIPGTGFIEIMRAGFVSHCEREGLGPDDPSAPVSLRDVSFLGPFEVNDHESRTLRMQVSGDANDAEITLYTQSPELPLVVAHAQYSTLTRPPKANLATLANSLTAQAPTQEGYLDQHFMDFGTRWRCIDKIQYDSDTARALLSLRLDDEHAHDLAQFQLHPGLLDMATGGAQFLIPGFNASADFYVPVAYASLTIFAPLTQTCFSRVTLKSDAKSTFAKFDVEITDPEGAILVRVDDFTMKQVDAGSSFGGDSFGGDTAAAMPVSEVNLDTLEGVLSQAILPQEGVLAFARLMANTNSGNHIISSVSVPAWLAHLDHDLTHPEHASGLSFERTQDVDPDAAAEIPDLERQLAQAPGVSHVVVRAFAGGLGKKRFVAYLVATDPSHAPSKSDLNNVLAAQGATLRLSMVQRVETVGDRSDLADPLAPQERYEAPSTPEETRLAILWADLLGKKRVGVSDNFFELGGHSLLLTRLIARVQKEFQRKLDLETAYQNPTVGSWAALLTSAPQEKTSSKLGKIDKSKYRV